MASGYGALLAGKLRDQKDRYLQDPGILHLLDSLPVDGSGDTGMQKEGGVLAEPHSEELW